jgi:AAHS family 4-hydroxybenzoate transporter-like MFS transporter
MALGTGVASQRTIDVPALIDRQKVSSFQIRTAVLCFAVLLMAGYDLLAIANVGPVLADALHIDRSTLGPIFSAAAFGMMLGGLLFGPLADWLGRRRMIIVSAIVFGLCTLLTVFATTVDGLLVLRFLTGLGLGGALPNTVALVTELVPHRVRATMVTATQAGFAVGAALSGVIVAWLVDAFGWTTVFYLGGIAPLLLTPLLLAILPESIRFLMLRGGSTGAVAAILSRIDPQLRLTPDAIFAGHEESRKGVPMLHLFGEGRALGTTLLWIAGIANLLALNFLANWLPTLVTNAGLAVRQAVLSAVLFHGGGIVGAVVLGRLADLRGAYRVLPIALFVGAVLISLAGFVGPSLALILVLSLGMGFCIAGSAIGLGAVAGAYYPTYIRATGAGWATGIGDTGSVLSGALGTLLLTAQWSIPAIFLADAFFALCAAVAILLMGVSQRRNVHPE